MTAEEQRLSALLIEAHERFEIARRMIEELHRLRFQGWLTMWSLGVIFGVLVHIAWTGGG